jgi:hypothetical protein
MPENYPTITIRDVFVVKTLLDEADRKGSGAYRRAAAAAGISLALVQESITRVETLLGHKLLEVQISRKRTIPKSEPKERRKSETTIAGEQFKKSAIEVLNSWDKLFNDVAQAASYRPWLHPDERDY